MTALSVRAAARENPKGHALISADGRRWNWQELAAEVEGVRQETPEPEADMQSPRPVTIIDASPEPETVFRILAAIEDRVPFAPIDPRLPDREIQARRARLATHSDAMAILFTSGSTGRPRGVELSRAAFLASARASAGRLGWRDGDRWLCVLPLAHVGGLSILTRCLAARRTVVLAGRFDAESVVELVGREQVTLASLVPTMLARLLAAGYRDPVEARFDSLRAILLGGAAASDALWDEVIGRGMPVLETWGMTETCSQVATALPGRAPRAPVPLAGWEVRSRDGRLEVRGEALFSNYLDRDGSGRPVDEAGWFRTGDAGRVNPDGSITVRGRGDDLILSGGENVDPAEVERFLAALPGVGRAVVLGIEDPEWGETIAAALERAVGAGQDPAGSDPDLNGLIREGLAPWQRPRTLVWMDRFPETVSGKVNRAEVRAGVLAGLTTRHIKP